MVMKVPKSENVQLCRGYKAVFFLSFLVAHVLSSSLKKYLAKFQIPPDSGDFIFRPTSKCKDSCKLITSCKLISYGTMREAFRQDLKSYGTMREVFRRDLKTIEADSSKFGQHSLRSGGATMTPNSGVRNRVFL